MAIPDYQTVKLPSLRLTADQKEYSLREAIETLGKHLRYTPEIKQVDLDYFSEV